MPEHTELEEEDIPGSVPVTPASRERSLTFNSYSFMIDAPLALLDESNEEEELEKPSPDPDAPIPNEISPLGLSRRQIGVIFIGLMLALFLASLDQTIVSTALPSIVSDFGRLDLYSWVVIAYLLTSTAIIPLTGKLSDIFGRKLLFQGAVVVFLVGSILCGAAPNMISLIIFRAFQGIGGGALISLTMVIIGDIVTIRERGRWVGLLGMVFALSSVLGPVVGGVITDNISWRWIFYINIPIGIITLVVTQFFLKLPIKREKKMMEVVKGIDYGGMFTIVTGIVLVLLGASLGGSQYEWNSAAIICFFIFGGLTLIAFGIIELKVKEPIMQFKMFLIRNVCLANLIAITAGFSMFGSLTYLPIYFQVIHGDTPTISGLKLLPLMIGLVAASITSGGIITKTGVFYWFPIVGTALMALGNGLIGGLIGIETNIVLISFFIFIVGVGIGNIIQTLTVIVQGFVERKDMAIATSANSFLRTMGGVLGVTIQGAILNNYLEGHVEPEILPMVHAGYKAMKTLSPELQEMAFKEYVDAIKIVFIVVVPVSIIGLILSIAIQNKKFQAKVEANVEV